ncbi:MAG TPA: substrate-binding domain-containing protein [Candidatus Competibacteraceae bacterium]|nr:substrate-binding domain-containing protein [Candidatus Competibacteraceae bacterium]
MAQKGQITDVHSLVYHTAVIGVNRAHTASVTRFEDLAGPGRRLALGDPKAMALGRTAEAILDASGLGAAIRANVVARGAIAHRAQRRLQTLSGGERQRAALADRVITLHAGLRAASAG